MAAAASVRFGLVYEPETAAAPCDIKEVMPRGGENLEENTAWIRAEDGPAEDGEEKIQQQFRTRA
ncbi:hypothetical protein PsorP6_017017 [Peronosclerospora sorghi]|uniref:Uncharacterized protein n=1 Tax=Peronosclerospora sorghi TaxID=230839 RepID=A0ACC0WGU4_9STRA|nr:hypothetical protein PsorP6_017017 [Peronosclerospora sorghi]